jgi:hypothetical protein
MKYNIVIYEKPGMINHWGQLELPDGAIPLHTEIWRKTHSEISMVHDIEKIFNEDGYKYDKETGEVIQSRKDGRGLEEFKLITRIYCLARIQEECKDNSETCTKIAKMIEKIKKRKYEQQRETALASVNKLKCLLEDGK